MFTERSRRLWAATEADALGHGGIGLVERATGISRATIPRGVRELEAPQSLPEGRSRRRGGGRKAATALDATLLRDLDALVEPTAAGDPVSPLRWSCKSTRTLAVALQALGHAVSHTAVATLLHRLGSICKATSKRAKAGSIPIAMRSFATSRRPSPGRSATDNRPSPSTPIMIPPGLSKD